VSVKRPPKRYLGLRFAPASASRREVSAAVEAAWRREKGRAGRAAPRLLVCEDGVGIVVVARGEERAAREALEVPAGVGAVALVPVVTSGTIAAVRERMAAPRAEGARTG